MQQIIALESELSDLEAKIARQEAEMNAYINRLYDLTEEEQRIIAQGYPIRRKVAALAGYAFG